MWYPSLMYGSLVSEIGHNLKIRTDHDRILNNKDPMHHVRSSMTGSISRIKTLQSQSGGLKHLSAAFIRIDSDQGRFLRLGMHIGLHQSTRYITEYPKSQRPRHGSRMETDRQQQTRRLALAALRWSCVFLPRWS